MTDQMVRGKKCIEREQAVQDDIKDQELVSDKFQT